MEDKSTEPASSLRLSSVKTSEVFERIIKRGIEKQHRRTNLKGIDYPFHP